MPQVNIKPGLLLLRLLSATFYLALSFVLLRGICPALISAESDVMVFLGFGLIALWLIASICLAAHLFANRRELAANTKEENL
jgi:hypothetical protein